MLKFWPGSNFSYIMLQKSELKILNREKRKKKNRNFGHVETDRFFLSKIKHIRCRLYFSSAVPFSWKCVYVLELREGSIQATNNDACRYTKEMHVNYKYQFLLKCSLVG